MAYTNTYTNGTNATAQNQKNSYELSMYSNYRMNNAESLIDPTCISFRFWKSNLCISIFPRKETNNGEIAFDMDNGITIYLSHTKARIFKNEIENYLRNPEVYNGVGVPSGQAIITISNGTEYGKNAPVISIRKIDENGNVVASFAYEFKRNYHYSLRNYFGGNEDFTQEFDNYQNIEIEQLVTLLDEYCKASTNAIAFTVMDQRKYSASRLENKVDAIANSLGVEMPRGGNTQRNYSTNSYFNSKSANARNTDYQSDVAFGAATIDDLDD